MPDNVKYACPSLLSTAAIIMTLLFAFWCESFQFDGKSKTFTLPNGETYNVGVNSLQFSPWYMKKTQLDTAYVQSGTLYVYTSDECVDWISTDLDTKWNFVRAATVITPILGGILTFVVCLAPCAGDLVGKMWHCMALTFIVVLTLFQGLTFLIFKSNACDENPVKRYFQQQLQIFEQQFEASVNPGMTMPSINFTNPSILWEDECSWDSGSTCNVIAICLWFITGLLMLAMGAPKGEEEEERGGDMPVEKKEDDKPEAEAEVEAEKMAGDEKASGGEASPVVEAEA